LQNAAKEFRTQNSHPAINATNLGISAQSLDKFL
jgi:hypothetical protein